MNSTRVRIVYAAIVGVAGMLAAAQGHAQPACVGDCGNDGQVTVPDLVLGVNIVLGNQPASACPNLQNAQGDVDIVQIIEGVNNLLNGCSVQPTPTPTMTPLIAGTERHFVVAPGTPRTDSTMTTTGLFTNGLSGANAATAVCGRLSADGQSCATLAEMTLVLGEKDNDGIHDLILKDDAHFEIGTVDGSRICLTFVAATSEGSIDCDGGTPYDIEATRVAGAPGMGFTFRRHLGPLALAGNGELLLDTRVKVLPANDTTPCNETTAADLAVYAFTTTTGTATITGTDLDLSVGGQAFSCDEFAMPGSGLLIAPLPTNQPPAGDAVNALRFGEASSDQQALFNVLKEFGVGAPIQLDTAALATAVRAGQPVQLPFGRHDGGIVQREVQLTLRNLRSPELTEFVLKDGAAGTGSSLPLPPPATYQGKVRDGGAAVFTITAAAVEGSMLVAPDGWAFIEPLEPQLRQRNVDPGTRQRLLTKYNHIVYNARDAIGSVAGGSIDNPGTGTAVGPPQPPVPLIMSMVADGDVELLHAYPLDSVMPFWLKQESLLNAVDWLYNCVEPDANAANAYSDCSNDFDGGSNFFQARVRIDRLEVWKTGGPDAPTRGPLLEQSIAMTHQASPLCCGEPHTAGQANLVYFFSGKDLFLGAGEAAGIGGLNYYGPLCSNVGSGKCHHAVSQIPPGRGFRGTRFHQESLLAHEIGHVNAAEEISSTLSKPVCWLFEEECGDSLMASGNGFNGRNLFLYYPQDAREMIGPLLAEQLERAPSNP